MSDESKGVKIERVGRMFADLLNQQEKVKEAKKALKENVKDAEDPELMSRLKELKDARKTLSVDIKELQIEVENLILQKNPDVKDFREQVLLLEEELADMKAALREEAAPLLEKDNIVEITVPTAELPTKIQIMRGVVANINGKEQNL